MSKNIFLKKLFKKKKYLNLESDSNEKIFNIYTTGICNWGNFNDDQNLVQSWKIYCRDQIISHIPDYYKIHIYHYDPILESSDQNKKKIIKYINKHLIPFDLKHKRVKVSEFHPLEFNHNLINLPNIIIDLAHIYTFHNDLMNKVSFYNENNSEIFNLNVLRFGFVPNMKISQLFLKNKLFDVDEEGNVRTYIDMLSFIEYDFDESEPILTIEKLLNQTTKLIENKISILKSENNEIVPTYKIRNIVKKFTNKDYIIAAIVTAIWDSSLNQQTIESISNNIIQVYITSILNMDLDV